MRGVHREITFVIPAIVPNIRAVYHSLGVSVLTSAPLANRHLHTGGCPSNAGIVGFIDCTV